MLVIVPTSPRNGSILAGIISIVEFVVLIVFLTDDTDYIEEKGFIGLVIAFLVLCIITSVLLIIGVVKMKPQLIIPFIVFMSLFIIGYAISFIVTLSGEHKQQDWTHFSLILLHVCYLIGPIAMLRIISRIQNPEMLNVTISPDPLPSYGHI